MEMLRIFKSGSSFKNCTIVWNIKWEMYNCQKVLDVTKYDSILFQKVPLVFQDYFKDLSNVIRGCLKSKVSTMFFIVVWFVCLGCINGVTAVVIPRKFNGILRVIERFFTGILRLYQNCFFGIAWGFWGCFKGLDVHMMFEGCLFHQCFNGISSISQRCFFPRNLNNCYLILDI